MSSDSYLYFRVPAELRDELAPFLKQKRLSRIAVDLLQSFVRAGHVAAVLEAELKDLDREAEVLAARRAAVQAQLRDIEKVADKARSREARIEALGKAWKLAKLRGVPDIGRWLKAKNVLDVEPAQVLAAAEASS